MPKILITRGANFKGSCVVKLFASQRYEIGVMRDVSVDLIPSARYCAKEVREAVEKQV